jgi:hypothetical protein
MGATNLGSSGWRASGRSALGNADTKRMRIPPTMVRYLPETKGLSLEELTGVFERAATGSAAVAA